MHKYATSGSLPWVTLAPAARVRLPSGALEAEGRAAPASPGWAWTQAPWLQEEGVRFAGLSLKQ